MEYGGDAEGKDYTEEDFVMDVDIFSPLQSTQKQLPKQPPLPDYLPLEVEPEVEPEVVSGSGEFVMVVCWDKLSLCNICGGSNRWAG